LIAVKVSIERLRDKSAVVRDLRVMDMGATLFEGATELVEADGQLRDDHEAQEALCVELELLADSLPALPATPRIRRLCGQIEIVTRLHLPRSRAIFCMLTAARNDVGAVEILRTVADMAALDTIHGEDVIAMLWRSVADGFVSNPGELGYMLRCFFEGRRRAIMIERALLLRLIGQIPSSLGLGDRFQPCAIDDMDLAAAFR